MYVRNDCICANVVLMDKKTLVQSFMKFMFSCSFMMGLILIATCVTFHSIFEAIILMTQINTKTALVISLSCNPLLIG